MLAGVKASCFQGEETTLLPKIQSLTGALKWIMLWVSPFEGGMCVLAQQEEVGGSRGPAAPRGEEIVVESAWAILSHLGKP